MGYEIEHKYLVKNDSYREMATRAERISQGYLSRNPERTVRVRIKGEKAYITIKGITQGDTRREYEYAVPMDDAEEMLGMCEPPIIDKVRHIVEYEGFTWEVDEFQGDLSPLVIAEIELPSADTRYALPPFVGENVTGNPEYYNSNLAKKK